MTCIWSNYSASSAAPRRSSIVAGGAFIQWRKAKPETESLAIRGLREAPLDGLMADLARKDAELKRALDENAKMLQEATTLHRQLKRLEGIADEPPPHLA